MENQEKSFIVRHKTGAVRVRKNIRQLSTEELNDLRKAFEGLYAISEQVIADDRGYQWISGVHGLPVPFFCQHGNLNFVTWHRAYLYEFEKRLQDIVPSVMLPYWDWASETSIEGGMPEAVTAETYVDAAGDAKPNPLNSAFSQVTGQNTRRDPSPASDLQFLADGVADAMAATVFTDFSQLLESPHGGLHVWVGGDMGRVPTAAYDPIFWLHHCNVDRQWWQWQQANPTADVPQPVKDFVCAPFIITGEETLDSEGFFGVTYAEQEIYCLASDAEQEAGKDDLLPPTLKFSIDSFPEQFRQARLELHNLHKTAESYEIRVFTNSPNCDVETERTGNANYAGSLFLFGHGGCWGAPGHCDLPKTPRDKFDHRSEHHLTPYNTFIDVTGGVRAALAGGEPAITLHFVVVDAEGKQVKPSVIEYDGIALMARD